MCDLLRKLTFTQLLKISPAFICLDSLSSFLQECLQPVDFITNFTACFSGIHFNTVLPSTRNNTEVAQSVAQEGYKTDDREIETHFNFYLYLYPHQR
jgi:hypothetical protein